MQQIISPEQPFYPLTAPVKPIFNIFFACESQDAFYHALSVQDLAETVCRRECKISRRFWNFALLRNELLRERAIQEVAKAALVVISLRTELPAHVKSWVEGWPVHSQRGEAALVTFLDSEQPWTNLRDQVAYLQRRADACNMDFLCNRAGWDGKTAPTTQIPAWEIQYQHNKPQADFVLSHPSWQTGGINE
jgi:hypothetical protein